MTGGCFRDGHSHQIWQYIRYNWHCQAQTAKSMAQLRPSSAAGHELAICCSAMIGAHAACCLALPWEGLSSRNPSLACMRVAKHSACMYTMHMLKAINAQLGIWHHIAARPLRADARLRS